MKENKYVYEIVLQGNYGYGWDDLVTYDKDSSRKERLADQRSYRENEHIPTRFINRRSINPKYK